MKEVTLRRLEKASEILTYLACAAVILGYVFVVALIQ
jgi:hypothetical protein